MLKCFLHTSIHHHGNVTRIHVESNCPGLLGSPGMVLAPDFRIWGALLECTHPGLAHTISPPHHQPKAVAPQATVSATGTLLPSLVVTTRLMRFMSHLQTIPCPVYTPPVGRLRELTAVLSGPAPDPAGSASAQLPPAHERRVSASPVGLWGCGPVGQWRCGDVGLWSALHAVTSVLWCVLWWLWA